MFKVREENLKKEKVSYEIRVKERLSDRYREFKDIIVQNFNKLVEDENIKLFKTDVENLWDVYINNIPKDGQEHYTCNACRQFIERYGDLVTINEYGETVSAIWDITIGREIPPFFKKTVAELKKAVESAAISKMFVSDERKLGIPKTGLWTHLHVILPASMLNKSRTKTAEQIMAEKLEDYRMLNRAIAKYSLDTIKKAVALLETDSLYRGEKCLGVAQWFKGVVQDVAKVKNSKIKSNIVWMYVAIAPTGYTHISSSMIGTLLDDIASGLDSRIVAIRFQEKMDPNKYMRSVAAPTAGAIAQAEKLVAELGMEDSLVRRYARYDEIKEFVWESREKKIINKENDKPKKAGVFSSVVPKQKVTSVADTFDLPTTTMTWEKFNRTILPNALSIEAKVDSNRLMALVTAKHNDAPNILQWDNPFSWYYHAGIDGEIKRRVEEFGGKHEGNEIRCSLIWKGLTDLDLHCITPSGEEIYYSHKRSSCGGWLDLDMNGIDKKSETPVENMRWSQNAPNGHYKFFVKNYSENVNYRTGTAFAVELEVNGQVFSCTGQPLKDGRTIDVFEFDYWNGVVSNMHSNCELTSTTSVSEWNIESEFVKVKGITKSPNTWGNNNYINNGQHIFFLLDGCKDMSEGKGRGFFNEMLIPELYEIRKTLEAFNATTPIQDIENASACGVGYTTEQPWGLELKVKTSDSTRKIIIDRWD